MRQYSCMASCWYSNTTLTDISLYRERKSPVVPVQADRHTSIIRANAKRHECHGRQGRDRDPCQLARLFEKAVVLRTLQQHASNRIGLQPAAVQQAGLAWRLLSTLRVAGV